ncbi:MAG: hypothetical protein WBO31_09155 [Saprospiraceae bacterium]|nr:hypothetical protein [Saprospiraceae bacterium]
MDFNERPGDEIKMVLTISGTRGLQDTIIGYFVSYNPIKEGNTVESVIIDRILNLAEFIRFNENPVLHRQTFTLRNYNSIGRGRWDF